MADDIEVEKKEKYVDEEEEIPSSPIETSTRPKQHVPEARSHHSSSDSIRSSTHSGDDPPSFHDLEASRKPASVLSADCVAIKVPRLERRGLFANLSLIPEVDNPYNWPNSTKWWVTFIVGVAAAAAPMGSAVVLPALTMITEDLHAKAAITNFSVAFYMLSMSIFPLWWSSFSETFGRRSIYLWSFALFVLWSILSAEAKNIAMFIVMRVLSGGAGACVQAVGAGTIADIWEPKERGRAMGIFYLGPLCGPLLAPIIGGALAQNLGWRSTQWFLVIYGAVIFFFILFGLPETLKIRRVAVVEQEVEQEVAEKDGAVRPNLTRISTRQSVRIKTKKYTSILRQCIIDPLKILLWLRFPAVAMTVMYGSIAFGCLYFLNISVQVTFSAAPYNFSTMIVGLLYIPNSLGYVIASIFGGKWIDYIMKREAKKAGRFDERGRLVFRPEDRMKENAWIAAIMFPGAIIWYGWTAQKGVFWFVPVRLTSL